MLKNVLASKIIELVEEKKISQTEFAKMLGVSQSYISRVKSGKESFSLDRIELACALLDYPVFGLFADDLSAEHSPSEGAANWRNTINNPKVQTLCGKIDCVSDKKKEKFLNIMLSMVDLMLEDE